MNPLIKNWRYVVVLIPLIIAIFAILFMGMRFGIDFKGGTLYQVELQNQLPTDEMARIANVISQRIDPSGLRGDLVSVVGGKYVMIQTTETVSAELEKMEMRIRQQGKFEATLNGETIFTGDEIRKVLRSDNSYGVGKYGNIYEWSLPFVLNEAATNRFTQKTFHQCTAVSFSPNGTPIYECEKTIFFLDKPNALVVMTPEQYDTDTDALYAGNRLSNIPAETKIDELIQDSQITVIIYDQNAPWDQNVIGEVLKTTNLALVSPDISEKAKIDLNAMGFIVTIAENNGTEPWIWNTLNARQIISLTEDITNEDVVDISQAKTFSTLRISGQRETAEVARADLEELTILLESGSLPTPVKSISRETISPSLGESFLNIIILMGIVALIAVAAFIIIRYRTFVLAIPVFATVLTELIILLGFLALTRNPLDLAAFAGLIAALGSGVNSEVVIVDEIMGKSTAAQESVLQRVKNALFIITTSTVTIVGVMLPIVLFSRSFPGVDKLFGYAVVAIVGSIIGVLFTRPAFTKIIENLVNKRQLRNQLKQQEK